MSITKSFKTVLFDLDGTLIDSGLGITNSIMHSLRCFGMTLPPREELYKFIGPPLTDSFIKYYGFSMEKAELAVKYYREYYTVTGVFENTVYDGVPKLLKGLSDSGIKVILATSKPEVMAVKILKHYDLYKYFNFVKGATLDGSLGEKSDIIKVVLNTLSVSDKSEVAMVGDRCYDIIGAKENNISSLGVLYGYGNRNELENAKADYIFESTKELSRFLLG